MAGFDWKTVVSTASGTGIVGLLVGRWWHTVDSKKKADAVLFRKFREALPHEVYRNFIDDTWNMHYYPHRHNGYLEHYRQLFEDPANSFKDLDLQERHAKFATALQDLLVSVSVNFAYPNGGSSGMNLQCVAPHESNRYKEVASEVRSLNDNLESCYKNYMAAAKKKLII